MVPRRFIQTLGVALLAASASAAAAVVPWQNASVDTTSLELLTRAADGQVPTVLANKNASLTGSPRSLTREVRRLVTPFVWPDSAFYHDETLLPHVDEMLAVLARSQHDDGTYTVGNRHSPPDTGFLVEDFGIMVRILEADDHEASRAVAETIRAILVKAGPGLAKGGIHTPNHRWKICGALARISRIAGDEDGSLVARVDEWLAEGVDMDADGIYSERSAVYYAAVTNPSLLTVAHELGRAGLLAPVRKNLELTIEHAEPGGEIETVLSRRQDQAQNPGNNMREFYPVFREMALLDGNARFAAMARLIERQSGADLGDYLGALIERPALMAPLPGPEEPPFVDFEKHYAAAGLVRARRGKLSVSVFGGSDWYRAGDKTDLYNRFGSGLSTNPTMFRAWNGKAVLEAVRLVPNFFTMGHFRSNGITVDGDNSNNNTNNSTNNTNNTNTKNSVGIVRLGSEMEVPYYLPMPAERRDENGEYALGRSVADGRFYAALDFANRPTSTRRLKTEVAVAPTEAGYDLTFEVTGEPDVELTFELAFRKNGTFAGGGVEEIGQDAAGGKTYHLVDGEGSYSVGEDTITFGSGLGRGLVDARPGEQYSWLGGTLVLQGDKVYITGKSPLTYTLKLGFS
ncbi:hypothetical protein CTA1_1320 [Colletotrichum tanaceti]|uniref:Uncharacterized protein n=1 Tax=Colletotrichum tanaceti TaxID=1306861 RepID=A0A4U6X221_9PEZI|nr:hypothetical protein CTA1_1320 [Colletotrichum tanaceti]